MNDDVNAVIQMPSVISYIKILTIKSVNQFTKVNFIPNEL